MDSSTIELLKEIIDSKAFLAASTAIGTFTFTHLSQYFLHRMKFKHESLKSTRDIHYKEKRDTLKKSILLVNEIYRTCDYQYGYDMAKINRIFIDNYFNKLDVDLYLVDAEIREKIEKLYSHINFYINFSDPEEQYCKSKKTYDIIEDTTQTVRNAAKKALADLVR